jgi:hypothetical protein
VPAEIVMAVLRFNQPAAKAMGICDSPTKQPSAFSMIPRHRSLLVFLIGSTTPVLTSKWHPELGDSRPTFWKPSPLSIPGR